MFLTASCTAEEKPEERGKITLSAQTRVHNSANEYTSLQPGDQVGVYIAEHTEAETDVNLNMTSGELTELPGSTADITPVAQDGRSEYQAIVIPQTVAGNTRLFSVTNNGKTYDYTLESSKTFDPGTTHTCEITVNADDLHTEMTGSING